MKVTGNYQNYAKYQNYVKQQTQNTASTQNSQGKQNKKDSVEISVEGRFATSNMGRQLSLYELRDMIPVPKGNPFDRVEPNHTEKSQENLISYNAANFENVLKNWIKDAMNKTGIGFQDIEEIEIGLNESGQMTVSGLKNDSDNQKLAEALNNMVSTISPLSGSKNLSVSPDTPWVTTRLQSYAQRMFYRNSDYAMSAADEFERDNRATLIDLKNDAPKIIESMGVDLDFSQLYRTEEGKIAGYPEEAAWYFEADIAKPNIYEPSQITKEENYALLIRNYANMFLDAGYENIPNVNELNAVFKFNKSSFMDLNVLA